MAEASKEFAALQKRLRTHLAKGQLEDADRLSQELLQLAENAHVDDLPEYDLSESLALASVSPDQVALDKEHLRLLGTFYYVYGGLAALTFMVPLILFAINLASVGLAASLASNDGPAIPLMFVVLLLFNGARVLGAICAGRALKEANHARFIWLIAWLNILDFFFGTVLSVCTMLVMKRQSVKALFADPQSVLKRLAE